MSDGITDIVFGSVIIILNVVLTVFSTSPNILNFIAVACGVFLIFNGIRLIKEEKSRR